jgi:hypothetical protein
MIHTNNSTTARLEFTTSAAGSIAYYASYCDLNGTTGGVTIPAASPSVGIVSTATTTTFMPAMAATGSTRRLLYARISNEHATISNTITVRYADGATLIPFEVATLAPGECFAFDGERWRVIGTNGVERANIGGLINPASSAMNVVASAADTYVGGILVSNRVQAGSEVSWRILVSKTAAGTAAPILTFRTGTLNTQGDTSRVALTSPFLQTAVADTGLIIATMKIRTHAGGTSGIVVAGYELSHALAATGLGTQPSYAQAGTSAGFDTTAAGLYFSLSINPGTAGVWTMDSTVELANNIA